MSDMDELVRALEYPWDQWTVFLHPAQRQLVERHYNGAARVSGSAGTGKTVVALHRAVHLAHQDEDARVLLSTFSDTLANALRGNLYRLIWNTPKLGERIDVAAMDALGIRLYAAEFGKPVFASRDEISTLLEAAATQVDGLGQRCIFAVRMGRCGGHLASGKLGGLPRCQAAGSQDTSAGGAARLVLAGVRQGEGAIEAGRQDHCGRDVRQAG
ncbi:Superfamily I DNA and RNA helicases [Bordetella pertussis]|nr:Superfamily I DNA and RNA helicases [Bordetella pertussis]